jgi:putative ABC transport system permease protein
VGNVAGMLMAALRDMQWRKRRFVIAVLSTAIIFAMTLVLTGLANGFRVEAEKTVDSLGVDVFLVKAGASGPFVGATPFAPVELRRVAATPGVVAAAPLVYAGGTGRHDAQCRLVRRTGAWTGHARRLGRPATVNPRRGRGVQHAGPRNRR